MSEQRLKESETEIPKNIYISFARNFLPKMQEYFATEEGKEAYENWRKQNSESGAKGA